MCTSFSLFLSHRLQAFKVGAVFVSDILRNEKPIFWVTGNLALYTKAQGVGAGLDIGQNEYPPNKWLKLTAYRRRLAGAL